MTTVSAPFLVLDKGGSDPPLNVQERWGRGTPLALHENVTLLPSNPTRSLGSLKNSGRTKRSSMLIFKIIRGVPESVNYQCLAPIFTFQKKRKRKKQSAHRCNFQFHCCLQIIWSITFFLRVENIAHNVK